MILKNTLAKIVVYCEIAYPWQKIATQLRLKGRATPRMAYNRYIKKGSSDPRKPTSRPHIISERGERFMVRWLEKDVFVNPERLRVLFNSFAADEFFCEKTIRRVLRRRGYSGRAAEKKLLMKSNPRQKRMECCRRHRNWTDEQWGRSLFSAEVGVQRRSDGSVHVWRGRCKNYDTQFHKTPELVFTKHSVSFTSVKRNSFSL